MKKFNIPPVISHRTTRGYAPENTLAGVYKAKALGIPWVEVDVMLTQDGTAILFHDEQLDRTTNAHGEVGQTSYSVISTLKTHGGEPVPTLIDLINCLAECQLGANIEIKPYSGQDEQTAQTVVAILKQYWPATLALPLISSFSLDSLRAARKADPHVILGFLMHTWQDNWQSQIEGLQCVSVHVRHTELTPERIKAIKQAGYYVLAYTVNDPERAHELFKMGVDSVFSDYPDKILSTI
jgi:glycerophosphoryl diester phosphodiesterase